MAQTETDIIFEKKILVNKAKSNWLQKLSNKNYWAFYFLVVVAICVGGIGYFGEVAHYEIPPLCDFVDSNGKAVFTEAQINHGEELFHLRGIMSYGSFLGDGSKRGRDYTVDALHELAVSMTKYYEKKWGNDKTINKDLMKDAIKTRVRTELRNNAYDESKNVIVLNDAQVHAFKHVVKHYSVGKTDNQMFGTLIVDDVDILGCMVICCCKTW